MIQSKYKWVTKKTDNVITEDTIKAFNITPLMQSI